MLKSLRMVQKFSQLKKTPNRVFLPQFQKQHFISNTFNIIFYEHCCFSRKKRTEKSFQSKLCRQKQVEFRVAPKPLTETKVVSTSGQTSALAKVNYEVFAIFKICGGYFEKFLFQKNILRGWDINFITEFFIGNNRNTCIKILQYTIKKQKFFKTFQKHPQQLAQPTLSNWGKTQLHGTRIYILQTLTSFIYNLHTDCNKKLGENIDIFWNFKIKFFLFLLCLSGSIHNCMVQEFISFEH